MTRFDDLWHEFNDRLLAYIKSHISNTEDAEDILQNVFLKVYKNMDQLEHQEALKSWLYRITKNTIIDFYKKKKDISLDPSSFYDIEDEDASPDNMNEEISACLRSMLFALPDKYQKVYDLYEKEDMKHKEIAKELDITVSASKIRLKRAKEMFKVKLVDCCDFEVDKYGNIIEFKSKGDCKEC